MDKNEILKDELIIKIDSSSVSNINKFINLLKATNMEVEFIGNDEYLIKL